MILKYISLLTLFLLLLIGCKPKNEEELIANNFKYFKQSDLVTKSFEWSGKEIAYYDLPKCFNDEYWSTINLSGSETFYCQEYDLYFGIDKIPLSDMEYYHSFLDNKFEDYNNVQIIAEYITTIKYQSSTNSKRSVATEIKTNSGKQMLLRSVMEDDENEFEYYKSLYYQFGFIEHGEDIFILQGVMKKESSYYILNDILELFKTFEGL